MDRAVCPQLAQAEDAADRAGILEQRLQLVPQPSRREVADEAHLDAGACKPRGVLLQPQAVPRLVADGAKDPRRVVDEREVVQHPEQPGGEVGPAAERVDEPTEVGGLAGTPPSR